MHVQRAGFSPCSTKNNQAARAKVWAWTDGVFFSGNNLAWLVPIVTCSAAFCFPVDFIPYEERCSQERYYYWLQSPFKLVTTVEKKETGNVVLSLDQGKSFR
eukprot:scpid20209/ scgid14921/ 